MTKILVIEDDVIFQTLLVEFLVSEGYEVDAATNPLVGLELFNNNKYDLILSDYDMDSVNGLQFFEVVKNKNPEIKFIILTGVNDDRIELRGLELEVDEFIKKPVSFEVLNKRIQIVLSQKTKLNSKNSNLVSTTEELFVDTKSKKVYKDNKLVRLTMTEYNILVYFLERKNETISRDDLLNEIWRGNEFIDTRAVDTHIKNIRAKLQIMSIYSVRGVGYEWVE